MGQCHNFVLAIKTVSQSQISLDKFDRDQAHSLQSQPDGQFRDVIVQMKKKTEKRSITIPGTTNIDVQLILDYSASFYAPDLTLIAGQKGQFKVDGGELS